MKKLQHLKAGNTVKIVKLDCDSMTRRRLMDMGIIKGTPVFIRKVAPLGDPIEVRVRGYELCLRRADLEQIEVEICNYK